MAGPVVIDFTNVQTGGTPVTEGIHIAALFDATMATTKKGDPMVKVTWKCQDGDTDAGRQVFDQYPIMESTYWKVKMWLEAMGEDVSGSYDISENLPGLVGRLALIEVEHEEYPVGSGKMKARVTTVRPYAEGETVVPTGPVKARRGGRPF
ncbi:MAG TPA: hypothetical protein VIG47_02585 [Gemmatimonadaceae bacterium]|jgi:hypothetical protein